MVQGKCGNTNCERYNRTVTVADGKPFFCDSCGRALQIVNTPLISLRSVLIALGAILIGAGVLIYAASSLLQKKEVGDGKLVPVGTVATSDSADGAPKLSTQFTMFYEKSAQKWIEGIAEETNQKSEGSGKIAVQYRGSRESKQDILYQKVNPEPVVWMPADMYWPQKLNADWTNPNPKVGGHPRNIIDLDKVPVVLSTRLVLIMREDRARVFAAAAQKPEYRNRTWSLLSDLATHGWKSIGGDPQWKTLRMIQTKPTLSNSGMISLALMFAEYRNVNDRSAKPESPGFLNFMRTIEDTVTEFPDTTSNAFKAFSQSGLTPADIVIAYEQNAIEKIDAGENVRIVYPEPTVEAKFPVVVLNAPWVTPEQAKDGQAFIQYLMTPDVQKNAIQYGFHPGINSLRDEVDKILYTDKRAQAGLNQFARIDDHPSERSTIDSLLDQWNQIYGKRR